MRLCQNICKVQKAKTLKFLKFLFSTFLCLSGKNSLVHISNYLFLLYYSHSGLQYCGRLIELGQILLAIVCKRLSNYNKSLVRIAPINSSLFCWAQNIFLQRVENNQFQREWQQSTIKRQLYKWNATNQWQSLHLNAVLWEDGFMVCLRVSLFGFTFYGSYCIFVSVVFGHKFLWLCSRVQNFGQTERCLWQLESGHFFFLDFLQSSEFHSTNTFRVPTYTSKYTSFHMHVNLEITKHWLTTAGISYCWSEVNEELCALFLGLWAWSQPKQTDSRGTDLHWRTTGSAN